MTMLNLTPNKLLALPLAAALVTCTALAGDAQPKNEYFGSNSNGTPPKGYTNYQGPPPKAINGVVNKGAGAMDSDASPELTWFEKFDEVSYRGRPTSSERIVLNMPFNQEQERVQRWTQVAAAVAKRYRQTARDLGAVQAPAGRADLDDYRTLRMAWFNDAAAVYEEMIKPRQPAQTIEELNDQLRQVKDQANSLGKMNVSLLNSDRELRRRYRVHNAKQTDQLTKYVTGTYK
ncbi:MAG: hypothetical protein Q8T09_07670 [Candidatus Melainabacteria bacterium]|nr:hypothetical protein [Candidatus Melainabacteria bacterium]